MNIAHKDLSQEKQRQSHAGPLAGLKVLDLSQIMAGPYCTQVLGDLGAEIIKIEKPGSGDDSRQMGPYIDGESACFAHINRNKLGVVLDIKTERGREIVHRLAGEADVVVENFRVGVTERLGVDYKTLSAINPGLIYCSISGYGQTGPYAGKGGFDLVAQGATGIMSITGEPNGRPLKSGIAIYDIGAGLTATYSILAARIHQMQTGEGQHIDISLAECGLPWFTWEAAAYFTKGIVPRATGSRHRFDAPYQAFKTGDGFLVLGAANQRSWERLCRDVLGRADLIDDPRFRTNSERMDNIDVLEPILEAEFAKRDALTWIELCTAASVPCGPINDFDQAMNDPHYLARDMVREVDHPVFGRMKVIGIPAKFSKTPGDIRLAAPTMGRDTDAVLEDLGFTPEQIGELRVSGVVQ